MSTKISKKTVSQSPPLPQRTWYQRNVEPYMQLSRLHKFPTGSLLIFWPAAWALTMAATRVKMDKTRFFIQVMAFFVGSTLLHSAACTINDICDRDFDAQVERCKTRPLPSGTATAFGASIWTILQTLASISVLWYANPLAIQVGLFGVFPLHALYPLMKRWTHWPQAWLGLAMNWGLPVAWLTVFGRLVDMDIPIVFFFGTWCWTIVYDTIYACQDRKDDVKAGVKSTAILFGSYVKEILAVFALAFLACMYYAGVRNQQGLAFFLVSVGGGALHFAWQLLSLDVEKPEDCWNKFMANHNIGYLIWAGMLLDYAAKTKAA